VINKLQQAIVFREQDRLGLLFVFNVGLEVADFFLYFLQAGQSIILELVLVEQLTTVVFIASDAKGLLVVHFVLLQSRYFKSIVIMKHVFPETMFVELKSLAVIGICEACRQ